MTARFTGPLTRAEASVATLGFVVLPLAEVVLRRLFGTGAQAPPPSRRIWRSSSVSSRARCSTCRRTARAARDAFAELTARMKNPDNADDAGLQAFLTEAQELVEGTGGGRKPAPGGAGRD